MNTQFDQIPESFTIKLADRVRQLKRDGVPVIGLQTGDPDFNTPQPIIDATLDAMNAGYTHYSNSRGLPILREAIANRMQSHSNVTYNPETEILVTHGAIHAYYVALQAILNVGDDVLLHDPSWQTHANMVRVLRANPIPVAGTAETGFFPTIEAWRAALTPTTRAIVINSPCNPTGSVADADYLQSVVDFATEHDLYVVADEVYDSLLYGREHTSVASLNGAKDRTLLLNSFSKTYAMTGWRIGYLCAPKPIIDNALKASQHSITNVAEFIQRGALLALTDETIAQEVAMMHSAFAKRRQLVFDLYNDFGSTPIKLNNPEGAFYFFIDATALGLSSNEIAERLLVEAQVALVPGSAYGDMGEGYLRMTTAASDDDIRQGFTTFLQWASNRQ